MATKTFKIGEYAKGGVITAIADDKKIIIIGKEWDFSTGSRKSSDQSNAKEFTRLEVNPTAANVCRQLETFLCDLTTSYYCGEIMKWLRSKCSTMPRTSW
jgi:hypothetical protein